MSPPNPIAPAPLPADAVFERADDTLTIRFRIPKDYIYTRGHFPDFPLVPGVAQVGWMLRAVEAMSENAPGPFSISRCKFLRPIEPGDEVALTAKGANGSFSCRIEANRALSTSAKLKRSHEPA